MNLDRMVIVASQSKFEQQLKRFGTEEAVHARWGTRIWDDMVGSHYAQKRNIKKVAEALGSQKIINRAFLTPKKIRDNDFFIFLGGDNHFSHCAQKILRYMGRNPATDTKYVTGTVLDPAKSAGALLNFNVDTLLARLPQIQRGDYFVDEWTCLEANAQKGALTYLPFPAVGHYYAGEYGRIYMSRNIVLLDGNEIFPDKSSGVLVVTGAGSCIGSWYDNEYGIMFGKPDVFPKTDQAARIILTGNKKKCLLPLYKGQTLYIDSYNDDRGILSPDSEKSHSVNFDIGTQARIWISDLKLKVVNVR